MDKKLKDLLPDNDPVSFKEHTELYAEVKSWHEGTNERLDKVETRLNKVETRLESLESEVKDFKQEVNNRFDKIDTDLQIIKNLLLQKNNGLKAVK